MLSAKDHLVIVGAGQAAAQLVMSLRAAKHNGPITLLGDEAHAPYSRPPLSKTFLDGKAEVEDLYFRPPDWYTAQGVDLRTKTRVTSVDRAGRSVETAQGRFDYDSLVLATGTRARQLPMLPDSLTNVVYLRSVADIERLRALMPNSRSAVVIGGGFIGLEFASMARKLGLSVTVLEAGDRLMARAVSPAVSEYFLNLHRENKVDLCLSTQIERVFLHDNSVQALTLADGSIIHADLIVPGVGAVPNDENARAADLVCKNGIVVDGHLKTSGPNIFAIGDCCSFPTVGGHHMRMECVQSAADQAKHLANILTGKTEAAYSAVPWFWTEQFDTKLQIAGLVPETCDLPALGVEHQGLSIDHTHNGHLICRESINDARAHVAARKRLKELLSPTPAPVTAPHEASVISVQP